MDTPGIKSETIYVEFEEDWYELITTSIFVSTKTNKIMTRREHKREMARLRREDQNASNEHYRQLREREMIVKEAEIEIKKEQLRIDEEQNIRTTKMHIEIAKLYTAQKK